MAVSCKFSITTLFTTLTPVLFAIPIICLRQSSGGDEEKRFEKEEEEEEEEEEAHPGQRREKTGSSRSTVLEDHALPAALWRWHNTLRRTDLVITVGYTDDLISERALWLTPRAAAGPGWDALVPE
ncbi:hypothetical protein E2C01_073986 [Portunus trituberculatus]|uniref:Uncharacterized protein n=1 Tax=Portunus trituberculatus TaxID=210409 RepID=A0A5B7IF50_PORTR|nr:hypothetical protein [Portunus trituberculatus]